MSGNDLLQTAMQRVQLEVRDQIGWVRWDDGKANAISPECLVQLDQALDAVEDNDQVRAMVLVGRPVFFSAGLDLKVLPTLGLDQLRDALSHFARFSTRLLLFPKPVLAGLTGHAVAGGAVLAFCADVRVAISGDFRIGLNEVAINIAVPSFILGIARQLVTPPLLNEMLLHSRLLSPQDALRYGVVDSVVSSDTIESELTRLAAPLTRLPLAAYAETKRRLRQSEADKNLAAFSTELEVFVGSLQKSSR